MTKYISIAICEEDTFDVINNHNNIIPVICHLEAVLLMTTCQGNANYLHTFGIRSIYTQTSNPVDHPSSSVLTRLVDNALTHSCLTVQICTNWLAVPGAFPHHTTAAPWLWTMSQSTGLLTTGFRSAHAVVSAPVQQLSVLWRSWHLWRSWVKHSPDAASPNGLSNLPQLSPLSRQGLGFFFFFFCRVSSPYTATCHKPNCHQPPTSEEEEKRISVLDLVRGE